jgi:hypothetical protein
MKVLKKLRLWQAVVIAIAFSFAVSFTAFNLQTRVTEIAPDAQSGIAIMYSLILNAALWLVLSIAAFYFLRGLAQKYWFKSVVSGALSLLVVGYAGYMSVSAVQLSNALIAAADPSTPSQRLASLADAKLGYGYELDNRLAANPSTPVDTLRLLYRRDGQIGTDLTLAANPNTPNDILIALSKRTSERWSDAIANALKRNPKVISGELRFTKSMTLPNN